MASLYTWHTLVSLVPSLLFFHPHESSLSSSREKESWPKNSKAMSQVGYMHLNSWNSFSCYWLISFGPQLPRVLCSQQWQGAAPHHRSPHQNHEATKAPEMKNVNNRSNRTEHRNDCMKNTHYCLLSVVKIWIPANAHNHLIYTMCWKSSPAKVYPWRMLWHYIRKVLCGQIGYSIKTKPSVLQMKNLV